MISSRSHHLYRALGHPFFVLVSYRGDLNPTSEAGAKISQILRQHYANRCTTEILLTFSKETVHPSQVTLVVSAIVEKNPRMTCSCFVRL